MCFFRSAICSIRCSYCLITVAVFSKLEPINVSYGLENGEYDEEGRMNVKCINTFYLTGYLTKGIQELSLENTQLKQENKEIKAQLDQLQNAVQEAYVQIGKLQKQGGN